MYKDSSQITEELLDEVMGINGSIHEVAMKCRLAIQQLHSMKMEELTQKRHEMELNVEQMQSDLDRYKQRLKEIYEELEGYGIIPKVAE